MPESPTVDLSKFRRSTVGTLMASAYGRFTTQIELHTIAQLGYGMDPRTVPVTVLQMMNNCPAVYFAKRTIAGIIRRPDLYSIKHEDPKVVAETEAWLWPLLPRLLAGAAEGYDYGSVTSVLDWGRETLAIKVATSTDPSKKRTKNLVDHTHFTRVHDVHPDETSYELDAAGDIVAATCLSQRFTTDRLAVWLWDPEFGDVVGQGAKRRAWRAYCEWLINSLLRDKFLERSVDAPKLVFTPSGTVEVGGVDKQIPDHVVDLLLELRGAGFCPLPGVREDGGKGERKYAVEKLDVNGAAADTFDEALNRNESDMFLAYLVSPTMSGGMDDVGGAASKTLDGMLREHVEDLACWVVQGLQHVVNLVHAVNNTDPTVAPPEVAYTDVGKAAARKIMLSVVQLANAAGRGEVALRTDMPVLLDRLGIPLRDPPLDPFADPDPSAGQPPGPDRKPTGDREERREDATTDSGEEDVGSEDVDGEERTEQPDAKRQRSARVLQTYADDVRRTILDRMPAGERARIEAELAEIGAYRVVTNDPVMGDDGVAKQVIEFHVPPQPRPLVFNRVDPSTAQVVVQAPAAPVVLQAPSVHMSPATVINKIEAPAAPPPTPVVVENHVHVPEPKPRPIDARVVFERRYDDRLTGAEITESPKA